ncbi:MAG: hypothetical protein ACYCQI_14240 [Gammaproteobacteria bacterium]
MTLPDVRADVRRAIIRDPNDYFILSLNTNEFLEQVLPVMRCLKPKPKPQGDLSKQPDPDLYKPPQQWYDDDIKLMVIGYKSY